MKKLIILVASASIALFSCNKEEYTSINETNKPVILQNSIESVNNNLDSTAKVLNIAIQNIELRRLIKQKAMIMFDGDFDILYSQIKNNYLESENKTVEKYLLEINPNFTQFVSSIPKFNISVPINCEIWDTDNYIPSIAISQIGIDDDKLEKIKTYKGNSIEYLSAKIDPVNPVVVVGICERVEIDETLRPQFDPSLTKRVSGCNEIIEKIKCPNLGSIEAWTSGSPELILKIYGYYVPGTSTPSYNYGNGTEITTQYFSPNKRKDINNKW